VISIEHIWSVKFGDRTGEISDPPETLQIVVELVLCYRLKVVADAELVSLRLDLEYQTDSFVLIRGVKHF
jgi:hypothetical protein